MPFPLSALDESTNPLYGGERIGISCADVARPVHSTCETCRSGLRRAHDSNQTQSTAPLGDAVRGGHRRHGVSPHRRFVGVGHRRLDVGPGNAAHGWMGRRWFSSMASGLHSDRAASLRCRRTVRPGARNRHPSDRGVPPPSAPVVSSPFRRRTSSPMKWCPVTARRWSTQSGPPGTPQQAGHPSLMGEWTGVAYGHGLFVAVSSVGTVVTSTNGIAWVRRFWRPQDNFTSITYGDGTVHRRRRRRG